MQHWIWSFFDSSNVVEPAEWPTPGLIGELQTHPHLHSPPFEVVGMTQTKHAQLCTLTPGTDQLCRNKHRQRCIFSLLWTYSNWAVQIWVCLELADLLNRDVFFPLFISHLIFTEPTDAEGLGRKLLLTPPSGDPPENL